MRPYIPPDVPPPPPATSSDLWLWLFIATSGLLLITWLVWNVLREIDR